MSVLNNDVFLLAVYIVITIFLILLGKYCGMQLFGIYHKLDPGSYRSNCDYDDYRFTTYAPKIPGTTERVETPEHKEARVEACAMTNAKDAGRSVGGVLGGVLGFLLVSGKIYQLYKNYNVTNV